jgi:autoinducer 2-degrading protein
MYVVAVTVFVKQAFVPQFIQATMENARGTRREPGNVRFDVLQAEEEPGRFLLYEVYHDKSDFEAHHQTAHYLKWKQLADDWIAQPRQAVKCHSLFFGDRPE